MAFDPMTPSRQSFLLDTMGVIAHDALSEEEDLATAEGVICYQRENEVEPMATYFLDFYLNMASYKGHARRGT